MTNTKKNRMSSICIVGHKHKIFQTYPMLYIYTNIANLYNILGIGTTIL